ncbi:MAG: NAD-binding protein [Bradymonadales bacterium]|nr:NAD-binding protein [Bradymonadales bacterium]
MAIKRQKKGQLGGGNTGSSVWGMALIMLGLLIALALLVFLAERNTNAGLGATPWEQFGNSLWLTIVTVGTVGYGDIAAVTWPGKLITIGIIFTAVLGLGFLVTRIETAVGERHRMRELGMDGTTFRNHTLICYWTSISAVALKELLAAERQVAVITEDQNHIPLIRQLGDPHSLFVTVGDPTNEDTLVRCNIKQVHTVIAASDEDTQNLIVALEAKQLNPKARIIVSTKRSELRATLTSSGVTYVASPYEMSGRLVASAAFEPEVALFIEDVSSGAKDGEEGYDLQQFALPEGSRLCNLSVAQINEALKQIKGPLLVAIAKHVGDGHFKVQPHPSDEIVLEARDSLIVLGNEEQNGRVADMLGVLQGR